MNNAGNFGMMNLVEKYILSREAFEALLKIITILQKVLRLSTYIIKDSKWSYRYNDRTKLYANFQSLIGERVSLSFYIDTKIISSLKKIRGNAEITIYDDIDEDKIIITDGRSQIKLVKTTITHPTIAKPDFRKTKRVGKKIELKDLSSIKAMTDGQLHIDICFFDGHLTKLEWDNDGEYYFQEISQSQYSDKEPELVLRSYDFLVIPGKEATLKIESKNKQFWLITRTTLGARMVITTIEKLFLKKGKYHD